MFDSIQTRCVQPKNVVWSTPTKLLLDLGDEDGLKPYTLLKGAEKFLYKKVGIKLSTSKEVYKKSDDLWKNLINKELEKIEKSEPEDVAFKLDKELMYYLINNNKEIVDIIDFKSAEEMEKFNDCHQKFTIITTTMKGGKKFFSDGDGNIFKLICYGAERDIVDEKCTPIIMLEMNHSKSEYKVYYGILIYNPFTFIPALSHVLEQDRLSMLMKTFDIEEYFEYADENADSLYESYKYFEQNPIEISAREMVDILKRAGYKLEIDEVENLYPITKINDTENQKRVSQFFNTFEDMTALQLLQLSSLKKTFRYNVVTLLDMLQILSKEYLNYDGSKVTAELLGNLVYKLHDNKQTDKLQVEDIVE